MRCPSSVGPSSVRPSLTFHIFDFSSETAERNSKKLDRKQDLNVLYQVCVFQVDRKTMWPPWPLIGWDIFDFSSENAERNSTKLDRKQDLNVLFQVFVFRADRKKKMAALASDWLRHFRLLHWKRWTEFNKTCPSSVRPSLTFHIFDFSSETAERNSKKLDRKQDLNVLYQVCVFQVDRKTMWPPWPLIGWDIFDFSSENAERNSTKLDRKQDLNVLFQVFVFRADRKNKMAVLASDWLRHFRLLLWNGIQRNLTGSKISTSSTKFVFFGPIRKIRWPPWPLIGWDIFDFSSETAERNSTKLDRK